MNFFPRSELLAALSGSSARETVQVSGVVVLPGRPRPVFLSAAPPATQREMLAFFANSKLRSWAGAIALRMGRGAMGSLANVELQLPTSWQRTLGRELSPVAIYCGSPGPLQKVTLLIPSAAVGEPGIVVKIALRPSADKAVLNESLTLERLAELPSALRERLPSLADRGQLASGRQYLATFAGEGQVIGLDQFPVCADFLRALGQATRIDAPWASGPAMATTREALGQAQGRTMADDVHRLLSLALDRVDGQLRLAAVPHVLAHGDFTRFNIRRHGARFSVFDWEYARRGANPIADVVHFFLAQPGRWSPLTVMHHTLAVAEDFLAGAYEGWRPLPRDIAALALHSLVDTMTFYATAGTPLDLDSFIVRRYLGLIGAADQWGLE